MLTCIMQQVLLYVPLGFESIVLWAFEGITISLLMNSYEKCSIFFYESFGIKQLQVVLEF